jgi:phage portal protein BeeE
MVKNPKALWESWNAAYGGSGNANRVAVIEEGMMSTPLRILNNKAQFLETREFQVDEICRIFRVSPHLVCNLEHATDKI